ncbi:MAG: class I SAM-dependent methyltransferase [Acidobacteria bacterium]|nr:class I SAM-dependent methyltransferase [Acidobacteriota bacterium]
MTDFDRVARAYRWLEYAAFGRSLQRARTVHLPALRQCRRILVIGDGDGRCVEVLATIARTARIHCIDTSDRMLKRAARRVPLFARGRVTFEPADVRTFEAGDATWDAVLTMFVLDCLTTNETRQVTRRLSRALEPAGQWLFADFVVPARGWRRLRARLWVGFLYRFFRWRTGLPVSQLPPSEELIEQAGLRPIDVDERQAGMVRSVRYRKPADLPPM